MSKYPIDETMRERRSSYHPIPKIPPPLHVALQGSSVSIFLIDERTEFPEQIE